MSKHLEATVASCFPFARGSRSGKVGSNLPIYRHLQTIQLSIDFSELLHGFSRKSRQHFRNPAVAL